MNWTLYFSALRAINRAKFWLGGLVKARLDAERNRNRDLCR